MLPIVNAGDPGQVVPAQSAPKTIVGTSNTATVIERDGRINESYNRDRRSIRRFL
jgi:hypothetical protein